MSAIPNLPICPIDFHRGEIQNESDQKSKFSEKYQRAALETLLIAKDKSDDTKIILKHNVTKFSYLYDRNYLTKPDKAQIVNELKRRALKDVDLTFKPAVDASNVVIVDYMPFLRSKKYQKMKD